MIIPTTVKIGAHVYTIMHDDIAGDADNRFGHCYPRKLNIYIDDRAAQSQQEETFFHEVLHAICSLVHAFPDNEDGAREEERIVQSVGHGLYQFLKENSLLK